MHDSSLLLVSESAGAAVITLKLLLMGDSGTGKSSILLRFTDDKFVGEDVQAATIGIAHCHRHDYRCVGVDFKIKFLENFGGKPRIKLTIWDTAGQERFRSLTTSYYRGAQGVILVYDVTRRETFENLQKTWLKELAVYANLDELILMIVGNKIDLETGQRAVTVDEGRQLAQDLSALFMESSAKTRVGIKAVFEELVLKILHTPHFWEKRQSGAASGRAVTLDRSSDDDDDDQQASLCAC